MSVIGYKNSYQSAIVGIKYTQLMQIDSYYNKELCSDGSYTIALAICVDKLTNAGDFTDENIKNCVEVNVIIKVGSLRAGLIANQHLVGVRIQGKLLDRGRIDVNKVEKHGNKLSVNVTLDCVNEATGNRTRITTVTG